MQIGKISRLTGASIKAIRHYEAIGLIPAPARVGRYRAYTEQDVILIRMIRLAQTVGFTLAELKGLVAHKAKHDRFPLDIANDLIHQKRAALSTEIARLTAQNENLKVLQAELNKTFAQAMPADACQNNGARLLTLPLGGESTLKAP
jgi:DNA-binding transcriptional MerR regulator